MMPQIAAMERRRAAGVTAGGPPALRPVRYDRSVSSILWRCVRWPGHEVAHVTRRGDGWRLEGAAAFAQNREPAQLRYTIDCDAGWVTQRATVEGWVGSKRIDVAIDANAGTWRLDGEPVESVQGCIDIDLNFSPSTNLLPIRRLGLGVGDAATVRAAWLRFPSFVLERLEQTYTRIAADRYEYRSNGFVAELSVTADGFVKEYADVWLAEDVPG
jgi:hypothetical protein